MKVNTSGGGGFSRSSSARSAPRSNVAPLTKMSYSSPIPGPHPPPKSPSALGYQCTVDSPGVVVQGGVVGGGGVGQKSPGGYSRSPGAQTAERAFVFPQSACKSPGVHLSSPGQGGRVFDFPQYPPKSPGLQYQQQQQQPPHKSPSASAPRSPNYPLKSPRSPRTSSYEEEAPGSPHTYSDGQSPSGGKFSFNLKSPPKSNKLIHSKAYHRQQYQTKSDSKSSLEYKSTTQHPDGDYQDIEYKICHSLDSDSQHSSDFQTCSTYRYSTTCETRSSSSHSSIKENHHHHHHHHHHHQQPQQQHGHRDNKKPRCNIRTNPGYDDRYGSSKSINELPEYREHQRQRPTIQRCRKSTSDLTDLTDDAAATTMTSLSRPSSPRRKSSVKGGLAYLASRRGSRDSVASNVSNEDIGPLNFQNTARGRQRRTSNFLELPVPDHIRPRVCSLPEKAYNPRLSDDLYRLRTFSITNKGGVVNCGDSIINRRSRSNTSVNSTASRASNVSGERSPFDGSCCGSGYHTVDSTPLGSPEEIEVPKYRVVMLGDSGVGKTALVSQFMTSEYMNTYDASLDDEFGERTVSVLLDGEESEMIFIDHPSAEMSVENSLSTYEPHACVVVYSIVARPSFQHVEETLNYLWREGYTQEKSVIVVGNKADLARSRVISANDGKALAVSRDCKFIETSSGIQHNVDELLVGILKQIRLRESREKKRSGTKKDSHKLHGSKTSLSLNIAREILQKICMNDISKSKSCENLHVL